ncbi:MAG: outer membrane protein transport protein [Planctomycetaceae bacterium]|nr:outer membrane protein transport protein [Planctomycetaceae bacterium]
MGPIHRVGVGDAAWGIGYQIGVYYESPDSGWNFGASYKSPQWFEDFEINSTDHLGGYRRLKMDLDYPAIISMGVGYTGFERVKLACDVRYIDYENTSGFQEAGFTPTGAVTGFGWSSIWAVSTGVEYKIHDGFFWRWGYTYNQSPIDETNMFYNSPAPALIQHHLSTGFSVDCGGGWMTSMAFHYGFRNSVSGNWVHPALGSVPGTDITASLATYGLACGISKKF